MDKQQKQIVITIGLVVVMVIAWANTFQTIKKRSQQSQTPPKAKPVPVVVTTPQAQPTATPQAVASPVATPDDDGENWGRDPFSGKVYVSKEGAAGYALTGIIWDAKNPQALINDEVYGEGARIDKYVVKSIESNKVILDDGVREIELSIE